MFKKKNSHVKKLQQKANNDADYDYERTGEPVQSTMRTNCTRAGLHTRVRLLLEAVREVKVIRSQGIEPVTDINEGK